MNDEYPGADGPRPSLGALRGCVDRKAPPGPEWRVAHTPAVSPLAGRPAPKDMLIDVARLEREYFSRRPDPGNPNELVSFGTSGHRGSPLRGTFTEAHILAITQAICEYRRGAGTDGPLYVGKDTHALSAPAQQPRSRCWRPTTWTWSYSRTTVSRRRR
jgi:hypothetical protein